MKITSKLNSLFLRWNGDTGVFQGAQCTRFIVVTDDAGNEVSRGESKPFSVGEAIAGSLPLAQIIGEANASLLVTVEAKVTEITALKTAAKPNEDALVAAHAQVAELTAQLAALQPPVDSFSRKQIKVALSGAGLLDQFETTISDPQDGPQKLAMISWEEDDAFTATSPALVLTFARMKLTTEQTTALFVAASV